MHSWMLLLLCLSFFLSHYLVLRFGDQVQPQVGSSSYEHWSYLSSHGKSSFSLSLFPLHITCSAISFSLHTCPIQVVWDPPSYLTYRALGYKRREKNCLVLTYFHLLHSILCRVGTSSSSIYVVVGVKSAMNSFLKGKKCRQFVCISVRNETFQLFLSRDQDCICPYLREFVSPWVPYTFFSPPIRNNDKGWKWTNYMEVVLLQALWAYCFPAQQHMLTLTPLYVLTVEHISHFVIYINSRPNLLCLSFSLWNCGAPFMAPWFP